MIVDRSVYHYALVTLEALSAHGIHAGMQTQTHDVCLLRDTNELPALPATSIAGVLRHLYADHYGLGAADELFGFANGDEGQPSWVQFGWGLVHDADNQPVEGNRSSLDNDALLQWLGQLHPVVRQRVRLNSRGAATDTGKFDVTLVPAGVRYSAVIAYWSDGNEASEGLWQQLLQLLSHPAFRLGHGVRNGAGAFKVQDLRARRYDLKTEKGRVSYQKRPRSRAAMRSLPVMEIKPTEFEEVVSVQIPLRAEGGWRVGGGDDPLDLTGDSQPDMLPQSEPVVEWLQDKARLSGRRALLPASAVKGALSHRLDYHYRCLTQDWCGDGINELDRSPASVALFGEPGDQNANTDGTAGSVLIDDLYLADSTIYTQMHNRIDRFTGGVINGALFEEALLWKTPLTLTMTLLLNRTSGITAAIRQAFARTLEDLANGWLPLGAGGSRGQGVFLAEDSLQWSDDGAWLQAGEMKGADK